MKFVNKMLNALGIGLGFVEQEFQARRVLEDDAAGEFVLDVAVGFLEGGQGALLLLGGADDADLDATVLEVGSDGGVGNGDKSAVGEVKLLHDLADLLFDQFGNSFDPTIAHINAKPRCKLQ